MKLHRILMCGAMALLTTTSLAHPTMTLELFRKFWPDAETSVIKRVRVNEGQKAEIKKSLGEYPTGLNDVDVFVVSSKVSALGVLANLETVGADIGVAVDRTRKKVVKVHFYTTPPGTEAVRSPTFLKQFVGKTADQAFRVGKDIKTTNGVSAQQARAVANTVKGVLLYLQKGW
jgi:hypothetical protein